MITIDGFKPRGESEENDLEKALGVKFVKREKDSFRLYTDKLVKLFGNNASLGVYRGLTENGYLVLYPHISWDFHLNHEKPGEGFNRARWETKSPELIIASSIARITSLDEEYLKTHLEESERMYRKIMGLGNNNVRNAVIDNKTFPEYYI